MRGKLNRLIPLLVVCIWWLGVGYAWSAPILYKQTMTKILEETQFQGWPPGDETFTRHFNLLTNSPDGSRIGFRVSTTILGTTYVHTYVANSDGSGIIDLTGHFPAEAPPVSAVYYKLDDTGSRLFFQSPPAGVAIASPSISTTSISPPGSAPWRCFPSPGKLMPSATTMLAGLLASPPSATRSVCFSGIGMAGIRTRI